MNTLKQNEIIKAARILEPELMTDPLQVQAYAEADFGVANGMFIKLYAEAFELHAHGRVIDLGCGPGHVVRLFVRANPECLVTALDGSREMIEYGKKRLARDDFCRTRIQFVECRLPEVGALASPFDTILSNSLLHHLPDPKVLWSSVQWLGRPGTKVQVMDLLRPKSATEAQNLVELYAGTAPAILKRDFFNSLLASFTVEDVQSQLYDSGLGQLKVRQISDRHWVVQGTL